MRRNSKEDKKNWTYDVVYWNFSPSFEDYLDDEDKGISEERMKNVDHLNHSNDDDVFNGGPCPSCRLAINKETGRLKWCMGGNDSWRFRVRLMLLIPALLLPITIIFIALSRSQIANKTSYSYLNHATKKQNERNVEGEVILPNIHTNEEQGSDIRDKRILIAGMKSNDNSLSDLESTFSSRLEHRRKRDTKGLFHSWPRRVVGKNSPREYNNFQKKRTTEESISEYDREVIVPTDPADFLSYDILEGPRKRLKNIENLRKRDKYMKHKVPIRDKHNREMDMKNLINNPNEKAQNRRRIDDYSELGTNEFHGKRKTQTSDYADDGLDEYPIKDEADVSNERDYFNQGSHIDSDSSFNSDDYDTEDDTNLDYHAFWKGGEDANGIREAQAKIMLKYMDKNVDPCQDFYQYACGNWAKINPIPKDKAGYDTFEMLRESLDIVLRELLEETIPEKINYDKDDAIIKAKYLYQSCMNVEILKRRKEQPLLQILEELGNWPILTHNWDEQKFDWLLLVAQLRLHNNDILISEWVGPDIKNSDQYIIQFDQTSLGLPTRDYFLQSSNFVYLEAYKNYMIRITTLLGGSLENVTADAKKIIEFETKLAKITSAPDERRNVSELYQRMTIEELNAIIPQIDWRRYLTIVLAQPVKLSEPVVVFALQYIKDLVDLLSKTNPRTISNYLLWRFVRHRVNNLDDRFQEAKQKFYYILFGREKAPPRWKICVAQVNSNMGMAVGSIFVKKYFDENSKNDTLSMTRDLQRSFRELLNETNWIDDETKKLASEKVIAMLLRIGYPNFILQPDLLNDRYKDVVVRSDKYFENTLNVLQHLTRVEQNRLGTAVNKSLWNTAPAVVNAYYSRNKNQIMFPAGILQPPFYHRYFPRSLNYGGIGVVIGHEITHGFDDKGRLFDKYGNLHRWWKDEAIEGFHQRAQCLIDQYSRYVVAEVGMQIDGFNTQGENIADNGGIKQAFRAYERWLRLNGDVDETLPGIKATGKQLFFLNFAQVWCGSMRPEATVNKLKTAVHSPGKFRVIGALSNSKDFSTVFGCTLGSSMNPTNKCSVW